MKPRIIVGGRSMRQSLLVVCVAALVAFVMPFAYVVARNSAVVQPLGDTVVGLEQLQVDVDRLARELRDERARSQRLSQEIADLERGREIDRQAYGEVQESLAGSQQEMTSLREQLAFYRGVVSPQALQSGLHVNELRISRGMSPDSYRYDLVLVQAARRDKRAIGRAELRFIGQDQSVQRSLPLSEVGAKRGEPLLFSFRHFQEFGGEFRLPTGFVPKRVVVTLMPDGAHSPHVEEEFEWGRIRDNS